MKILQGLVFKAVRTPLLLVTVGVLAFVWVRIFVNPTASTSGLPIVTGDGVENDITFHPEEKHFILTVASTEASRRQGLSGLEALDRSHGMLFVLDQPARTCFWMKDMKFDIDIIWFNEQQKLEYAKTDATPASYPSYFCPPVPAKYVIEVAAGTVHQLGLKTGDTFTQP